MFNLYPYILACFLRCKINFTKTTQHEYNLIKYFIESIKFAVDQNNSFDVKDIINLSSMKEVLEMLTLYGEGTREWVQTIKYFFMPSEDILTYQLDKALDEIKVMSVLKFNA